MRPTLRLLAVIKPNRYLEVNGPTGLTGLFNHPAPRSALIYLYSSILDKVKHLPESSVYRQSTESLTRHRLTIVESIKPSGFDAWTERARKRAADKPEHYEAASGEGPDNRESRSIVKRDGKEFLLTQMTEEPDDRLMEWDTDANERAALEASKHVPVGSELKELRERIPGEDIDNNVWEPEPPLEAQQISDLEQQIGAGLIEEVIQVAEGELQLVDTMAQAQVWEELQEKPTSGQWTYFTRDTNTGETQEP
ncbi:MAG: hypothetical protein M1817_006309 [Caeruleum heppii]|nr:MAG: hypothetical protein M1817_006309 [Caeruleum heppii]